MTLSKLAASSNEIFCDKLYFANGRYTFNIADFEYVDLIESASGSQNVVKEFKFRPIDIRMAVKFIRIQHKRYQGREKAEKVRQITNEIVHSLKLPRSPHIVNLYGLCHYEGELLLCMELMDFSLTALYQMAHEAEDARFPEELLGAIVASVINALLYCRRHGIKHRDIKPQNILINRSGEIKLCDFGESRVLKKSLSDSMVGAMAYWPPERCGAIDDLAKSEILDIYSLGSIHGRLQVSSSPNKI